MADSALTSDPLERYGAIERAYCEERWTAVIHDGQTLLSDLAHADSPSPEGLRERLQLLIGHAFLYGLGDRDSAEDQYQAVLRSGAEADLRQIAAQGLEQCALPAAAAQSPLLEEEPLEPQNASNVSPTGAGETEADLWGTAALVDSGSQPPSVPQHGPDVPVQDGWAAAEANAEPVPSGSGDALSWLNPEGPAPVQDGGATPVMPWLEGEAATGPALEPSSQLWAPSAEAPAQAVAPVPQPAAGADPSSAQASQAWAGDPGLSPESVASLQATAAAVAAAFGQQLGGTPPTVVFMAQTPASGVAVPPEAAGERLAADVVEEPEQLELRQAAGLEQEELLLQVETQDPPPPSVLDVTATVLPASAGSEPPRSTDDTDQTAPAPVAEPVPPLLLERRGAEPMDAEPDGDVQDDVQSQGQAPLEPSLVAQSDDHTAPPLDLRKDSPQDDSAAVESAEPPADFNSSLTHSRSGLGPFSAPPQPVAEEDPELLMGLLRVEMG